jgi:hypothetical protein
VTSPRRRAAGPAVLAAVILLAALAGCAAPAPAPTKTSTPRATSTPTPSATARAELQKLVIAADGIQALDSSGHSVLSLPYSTDAQTAGEELEDLLKASAVTATVTTDECYPELAESSWGGLHIFSSSDGLTRPLNAQFYVTADAATASGGVAIETTKGIAVGATRGQALSADPSAPSFSANGEIDVHYDIASGTASGDPNQYYGAQAVIKSGKVVELDSPLYYSRPC